MKRPHSRLISTLTHGKADGPRKATKRAKVSPQRVHSFVESLVAHLLHAKRVRSMSSGVIGVLHAATLGVHAIGLGLAEVGGLHKKHAVKQVDRLLSNPGIDVWEEFSSWVPFTFGARKEALVALDWTEFDADGQVTLCLNLVTSHGRATPLMWMTVVKSELAEQRNKHEDKLLSRLPEVVPDDIEITIVADRGFGDQARYEQLDELSFGLITRFRQAIEVTTATGESQPAADLLSASGRAKTSRDVQVTKGGSVWACRLADLETRASRPVVLPRRDRRRAADASRCRR